MLKVGMKVEAYEGRCIGILIEATTWQGEITKMNRKSIRVRLTECVPLRQCRPRRASSGP